MNYFRLIVLAWLLAFAGTAFAQQFPALSGRIVDEANLLSPQQVADLTAKSEALEQASSRQLVVATVPDLQGYAIEDYGYQLGRHWGIGQGEANNGAILIVAPKEKKVRIEVGYGLEPILTDAFANRIIEESIVPRFKAGDMGGGIVAGADAIIEQLQAPPELAEQRVIEAAGRQRAQSGGHGGSIFPLIFWGVVLVAILFSMIGSRRRFGRYRGRRHHGSAWPIILWTVANEIERSSRGGKSRHWGGDGGGFGGWGGGGFGGGGGGFGGFSGGGGSFGGGGASGSW